jgi:hypothetical protein
MWLKKAFDEAIEGGFISKSTFSKEEAIAAFGVGNVGADRAICWMALDSKATRARAAPSR